MHFKNVVEGPKDKNRSTVVTIIKGVLIAYAITAILLIIYGILMSITSLTEATLPTVIMIITLISIALSSIYTAIRMEARGWLNGAIVGLVYMLLLFFIGLIFDTGISLSGLLLFRLFMGFIIGALAGIIGINLK